MYVTKVFFFPSLGQLVESHCAALCTAPSLIVWMVSLNFNCTALLAQNLFSIAPNPLPSPLPPPPHTTPLPALFPSPHGIDRLHLNTTKSHEHIRPREVCIPFYLTDYPSPHCLISFFFLFFLSLSIPIWTLSKSPPLFFRARSSLIMASVLRKNGKHNYTSSFWCGPRCGSL